MRFEKWQALANDYVIVEHSELDGSGATPELVRALCDRHTGIGADGLLVLEPGAVDFPEATALPEQRRTVIRVDVERIADSCGFGVPLMTYEGERPQSQAWAKTKLAKGGPHALEEYVAEKNAVSIDGLPALG